MLLHGSELIPVTMDLHGESQGSKEAYFLVLALQKRVCNLPALWRALQRLKVSFDALDLLRMAGLIESLNKLGNACSY